MAPPSSSVTVAMSRQVGSDRDFFGHHQVFASRGDELGLVNFEVDRRGGDCAEDGAAFFAGGGRGARRTFGHVDGGAFDVSNGSGFFVDHIDLQTGAVWGSDDARLSQGFAFGCQKLWPGHGGDDLDVERRSLFGAGAAGGCF